MRALLFLFITFSISANTLVAFRKDSIYKMQGHLEGTFFVINHRSGNEQRFLLKNKHQMENGAQYELCLKMEKDCHMSCEAKIFGSEKFITPNFQPKIVVPDEKGEHAPTIAADCS